MDVLRKTSQRLLPDLKPKTEPGRYDIYPSFKLDDNQIFLGYKSLAEFILKHKIVIIDGYIGVFFDQFRQNLEDCLRSLGKKPSWKRTFDFLKHPDIIEEMISPFTGGDDPVFGKRTSLELKDFFNLHLLKELEPDPQADLNLIIGPGAALGGWNGLLVYLDLPKSEIQFRSWAGSIKNLGALAPVDPKEMYKRYYFVDWIVLNRHKRTVLNMVDLIVDTQET
jgi:hypothetical protein